MIEMVAEEVAKHFEFRFGKWWCCVQPLCDTVHHYYVESSAPA